MADYSAGHDPRLEALMAQAQAARDRAGYLQRRAEEVRAENEATRALVADAQLRWPQFGTQRDLMQRSAFMRLVARAKTMPVIEQAKGIIMTQSRCGEAEAFNLLRRASQRSNIPVRELAAQIVSATARALNDRMAAPNGRVRPRPNAGPRPKTG